MFQEWQYHHPTALSRDRPACLGSRRGSMASQAQDLLCLARPQQGACAPLSVVLPKALCWQRGDLAGSCQTSPTNSESEKGLGGDEEGETDAKPAGYWGGGLEQRSTSQFWGTRRYATHHHHCSPPPNRAASGFLPHLPLSPLPLPCLSACSSLPYTCDSPVQLRIGLRPV